MDLSDVAFYVAIHITLHFTSYYILNHITFHVACSGSAWRRVLLPALEPLSPVRSQGPKVVQTGPKLPLKVIRTGPKLLLKVMQRGGKIAF